MVAHSNSGSTSSSHGPHCNTGAGGIGSATGGLDGGAVVIGAVMAGSAVVGAGPGAVGAGVTGGSVVGGTGWGALVVGFGPSGDADAPAAVVETAAVTSEIEAAT